DRSSPDQNYPDRLRVSVAGLRPENQTSNVKQQTFLRLPNGVEAPDWSSPLMSNLSSYRTIAVASTFSPRFKQVLAEAKRIRDRFSAHLHLIYVGEGDEETAKKFRDALAQLQLPPDSAIHYEKGTPAEAILGALAREKIDM